MWKENIIKLNKQQNHYIVGFIVPYSELFVEKTNNKHSQNTENCKEEN